MGIIRLDVLILLGIGFLLRVLASLISQGNTWLIPAFLQQSVQEEDKRSYASAFARPVTVIGMCFWMSSVAAFLEVSHIIIAVILILGGLISSLLLMRVQKKYNRGN